MLCSPEVLAQQVRDNSCWVFFKTTYIVLVNHQEVAGGKNCCLLLLEEVNFNGYRLIRRTLGWITALVIIFAVCLLSPALWITALAASFCQFSAQPFPPLIGSVSQ